MIPEGTEVPRRLATWGGETPESEERTHEEEASQLGETSQRADAGSQKVVELIGLRMSGDRTGLKRRDCGIGNYSRVN